MNKEKILLISTMILCPTICCVYLYVKNRKLKKAFDTMTIIAETCAIELENNIEKEETNRRDA